ncbi:MAG: hypothetical protein ACLU30_07930 [Odoribacter splanchnicus]|jgi:hypothetical protein
MQIRLITPNGHKFVFVVNVEREKAYIATNSLKEKYLIRHCILMSDDKSTPFTENSEEEKIIRERIFKNFGIKRESRLFSWFFCHEAAYLDEPNSLVVAFKSEAVKNRRY